MGLRGNAGEPGGGQGGLRFESYCSVVRRDLSTPDNKMPRSNSSRNQCTSEGLPQPVPALVVNSIDLARWRTAGPHSPVMALTFRPVNSHFAAEASRLDLRELHDRDTLDQIRTGMDQYAVLVFRDQPFSDPEQLAFAQRFDGTLHAKTGSRAIARNRFGNEALTDISNIGADGNILQANDRRREYSRRRSSAA